jgi:hypothetical protein
MFYGLFLFYPIPSQSQEKAKNGQSSVTKSLPVFSKSK